MSDRVLHTTYVGIFSKIWHQCNVSTFSETFRKYPTTPEVSRVCSEECVLSGTDLTVQKGARISISVSGVHYDPQFYPDPEKFDPERFTEEKKEARDPYVYIPFGAGPRMCIG